MSRPINVSETVTFNLSSIDTSSSSYNTGSNTANAYTDVTDTSYANYTLRTGANAQTYVTFKFTTAAIPLDATINSVTGRVKAYTTTTNQNRIASATAQLRTGTTTKGSAVSIRNSSASVQTLSAGTWTRSELADANMYFVATRSTNNTGTTYSLRIYGGELTVNYNWSTTAYTIAATSNVDGITVSPSSQEIYAGLNCEEIIINGESLDDVIVTDNDVDVTSQLVRHTNTPGTFTATFIPASFDETNSVYDHSVGTDGVYSTNYISNGLTNASSTTRCALYSNRSNGAVSKMYYNFNCSSIPANAVITSVSCQLKAGSQGSSYYSAYQAYLTSGTTNKTSAVSVTGSNSSPSTVTISGGSWTRAELDNIKVLFQVTANSSTEDSTWSFYGATLTVNYTIPATTPYYWTYQLNSVNADHVILIDNAGPYVPPEEDPEETYWPVTISSINATTDPSSGTHRVVEGSNMTVTITPSDPQLTLALDNGVDITSQLVGGIPTNTYTVTTQVSGASYGFNLNGSTGYYVSTNNGVSKSASVARLNLDLESECLVTIQYINYAEANYDYGMFGKLDTAVATDGLTASSNSSSPSDSTSNYQLAMCSNSSSSQTITYEVPMGQHFIDIKYGKDDASDDNNDTLQWKVLSIEATSSGGDYTYTLTNITQKHSLIFVFGDVVFYYVNSTGSTGCRLFPDGSQVKLAGDSYRLNIVPDNTSDIITITDNNVDVTNSLEYESGTKDGVLVVSYTYKLTNIQATHNLVVSVSNGQTTHIYVKENNIWVEYSKVYKKINGSWVEQSDLSSVFDTEANYVRGN